MTEANKRQYVDLIARHRMTTSIKQQINAFTQVRATTVAASSGA